MKRTRLFLLAAFGLSIAFTSCNNYGEYGRQKAYNNATTADSEAFKFYKTAFEKMTYAVDFAKYSSNLGNSEIQALNNRILEVYPAYLTEMEAMAADDQVVLPDPGMPAFTVPSAFQVDSVTVFDPAAYASYMEKEHAEILKEFKRASRNTDLDVREYAKERLPVIEELYKLSGGTTEEGGH